MVDSVISLPKNTATIVRKQGLVGLTEQKVLFIGQKTSAGTASSGALVESIQFDANIDALFGPTSHIAQMLRASRKINVETQFDAIAVSDDGAGIAATSALDFTGVATEPGRLIFEIVSGRNNSFFVDVLIGDTGSEIATALHNKIIVDTLAPFTSADDTIGGLIFTAENAGTIANKYLLRVEEEVAGITIVDTPWAGGANDPDVSNIFDAIGNNRYQSIPYPGELDLTELTDLLDPRFNSTNAILDGVGIITLTDTLSNLKTQAEDLNSQSVVMFGNRGVANPLYSGSHIREQNDVMSAQFAAARSLRLTDGANLADIVVTRQGVDDLFGGIGLATLPYFNTPFPELPVPITNTFWDDLSRADLEDSGVSVIGPNKARNGVIAGEIFTTNTTDATGNPDDSFKFLNTVDASVTGREFQVNNMNTEYVQSRLTSGDLLGNVSIENEASIEAFLIGLYDFLSVDVPIYQRGVEAVKAYTKSLVIDVQLTAGNGLVIISQAPPLVGQLREIRNVIRINFDIGA